MKYNEEVGLIIVDVQNDFCKGGSLEVPNSDAIFPYINKIIPMFQKIYFTKDFHPQGHISFASTHGVKPFEMVNGNMVWPDHCVSGTEGVKLNRNLIGMNLSVYPIIYKGEDLNVDSYSGFFDNEFKTATKLEYFLREDGIKELFIVGLATDYCVKHTSIHAKKMLHYEYVTVLLSGCAAVSDENGAIEEMKAYGVELIRSL